MTEVDERSQYLETRVLDELSQLRRQQSILTDEMRQMQSVQSHMETEQHEWMETQSQKCESVENSSGHTSISSMSSQSAPLVTTVVDTQLQDRASPMCLQYAELLENWRESERLRLFDSQQQ